MAVVSIPFTPTTLLLLSTPSPGILAFLPFAAVFDAIVDVVDVDVVVVSGVFVFVADLPNTADLGWGEGMFDTGMLLLLLLLLLPLLLVLLLLFLLLPFLLLLLILLLLLLLLLI